MTRKVYSFSTRTMNDIELVARLKRYCNKTGVSFSTIVVTAIRKYLEETDYGDIK